MFVGVPNTNRLALKEGPLERVGKQAREQKRPQTWPGRGRKAGPGTKTARNVAGTGSEGKAGDKNGPKRGQDRVREQGRARRNMKPGDRATVQIALSPDLLWSASQFGLQCHL